MDNCNCFSNFTGRPKNAKIVKIIDEAKNKKRTLLFDSVFAGMTPGQFSMVWIRGTDEIPLGCSHLNGVTFQVVGDATTTLFELKTGDSVGLRGPFGRGFSIPNELENILIVAGGIGAAPLAPLAEAAKEAGARVTTLLGAKSADDLIFENRMKKAGEVYLTTDDGSLGRKGFVTSVLSEMDLENYSKIYVCGPEMMMKFVMDILIQKNAVEKSEFSMERYFKCGIGVCGACCLDETGVRVCKDGPVFPGTVLLNSEFGKHHRDASGKKIKYG
ncbi:dihydroorotate dehydrogenase electron transfer subunit [Methanolapillus ohkumae]|uniref:Probable dihydroorotate dehydrogenase B (NAD(+)), electron transfer subunit n=1 Tax=Methanolapillus ohkumae TaxID=3028298 RepID=A0AA96ZX90_9EURY|nr:Dihydroorotate dehydrogenase B (NAD(+)), electron transfer subunit [Methanosarcinaceae archaeon Am2]